MFWSDTNNDRIYRARLNGGGATVLISSGLSNTCKIEVIEIATQWNTVCCLLHRWSSLGLD